MVNARLFEYVAINIWSLLIRILLADPYYGILLPCGIIGVSGEKSSRISTG